MRLRAVRTEALWLLGCYLLAFVLVGVLVGSWRFWQGTLDIQMHNTYFVISNMLVTLVLFWVLAVVVTGARAIAAPLRTRYTWVVLLVFGSVVVLLAVLTFMIANKILK
jgi:hypothetical protein